MWIIELAFGESAERLAARPAHRDKLTALHAQGQVLLAGPLADDSGAVIVLDVPDREAVDRILTADPYFATTGVTVVAVREWKPFLR
ncbi:YciI family protein [Streptacidiphilus jiangxiensis]|uniref:YCII-related domain-containing protein n=1 Tax=Streptacidiphilus jiangxiensis TaxID=235985 RepID=A0A1H7ZF67_STRJI|nr:YciI family protein [Streptacidiphilus jiangxiensis]SEM56634.1 hypothetical protein SAMN05414137_13462 [Streptacidiphilus jiangxiensis]